MQPYQPGVKWVCLVSLYACFIAAPSLAASGISADPAKHWTTDNGNGTYSNPLFYEEFEDPDIIRVGEDYYLAGTTMHMNPAVQLMHSKDLVNWEIAGYCMARLDLGPAFRLADGRGIYGRGIWAPCIRHHNGMFYVFTNVNGVGLQVFRSRSIHGPWQRNQLPGRHDLSVLFDDDGKIYLISGNRSPYPIEELTPDLKSFVPGARHQLDARMGEGHHLYKINGTYYDISAIPGATTDQMVARADSIDGPWTVERMVQGESLGITTVAIDRATVRDRGLTLHQGGMCDTPSGQWWSVIMSDHGSAGRMVALVPITWDHGFPLIGLPGNLRKAPNTWLKPNTGYAQAPQPAFIHDDNFDSDQAVFSWSADGKTFTPLGDPFIMTFQLTTFQGVRPALFCFNTSGQPGGYADFDNYTVEEPRARGLEREIPLGKTIVLTSGADNSFLAADTANATLVNLPAADQAPDNTKFQVIDLGLSRIALKAVDGKLVSVDGKKAILKDLGGVKPGPDD